MVSAPIVDDLQLFFGQHELHLISGYLAFVAGLHRSFPNLAGFVEAQIVVQRGCAKQIKRKSTFRSCLHDIIKKFFEVISD